MTRAYYNEIDPYAAQWMRNLIEAGVIADGDVDERDIRDITPNELRGYTQCHFFAGIGVWSYALRLAGWPDDRPVWTGSPPCQPFSAAGRKTGVADERHLWPHWYHLIRECGPLQVFGEQVASKDGLGWLDLVQADMEGAAYSGGAVDLCAAGVGAPHIRQRQFFFFSANGAPLGHPDRARATARLPEPTQREEGVAEVNDDGSDRLLRSREGRSVALSLGHADLDRRDSRITGDAGAEEGSGGEHGMGDDRPRASRELADANGGQLGEARSIQSGGEHGLVAAHRGFVRGASGSERAGEDEPACGPAGASPTNGFWRDADWLYCRDGKWRAVEPETFPLVDGTTFRLGTGSPYAGKHRGQLLKGAGNAIVSEAAAHIIAAFLDHEADALAALDAGGSGSDLGDLL